MLCIPYDQAASCRAGSGATGFCGKKEDAADLRDRLIGALIGLARATEGNDHMLSDSTAAVVVEGLCAALVNEDFDNATLLGMMDRVDAEKRKLVPMCYECASACGRNNAYDMKKLRNADEEIRSLKVRILLSIRDTAAYAYHAAVLGYKDDSIHKFLYKALFAIGMDDWGTEELLPIAQEADEVKLKGAALL